MGELLVRVECYSGYKADERPLRIVFESQTVEISAVEDQWYSPGATYFRVLAATGDRYVLRRDDAQSTWALTAFRSSGRRGDTERNPSAGSSL